MLPVYNLKKLSLQCTNCQTHFNYAFAKTNITTFQSIIPIFFFDGGYAFGSRCHVCL